MMNGLKFKTKEIATTTSSFYTLRHLSHSSNGGLWSAMVAVERNGGLWSAMVTVERNGGLWSTMVGCGAQWLAAERNGDCGAQWSASESLDMLFLRIAA